MLDHSWKPFCESLFSFSVAFLMSVVSQKRRPFNSDFIQGEKNLAGARSRGCSSVVTLFFARKSLTNTGRCAGALSWRRNRLLVLHFSGSFLLTAALRRRRISTYRYYPHVLIPVNYNNQFRKIFEAATYFKGPNSRFFPEALVKFLLHHSCQISMYYSCHMDSVI